jgi:hypothetical protein
MSVYHFLPLLAFLVLSCGGPMALTEAERAKFDPGLQVLLAEGTGTGSRYDVTIRPDGTREYGVIVRTTDAEQLRAAGIRVQSVLGDVVTVRVTVDELRSVARLPSVRAVQNSGRNTLHNSLFFTPREDDAHEGRSSP